MIFQFHLINYIQQAAIYSLVTCKDHAYNYCALNCSPETKTDWTNTTLTN